MCKLVSCLLVLVLVVLIEATSIKRPPKCIGRCTGNDLKNPQTVCTRNAETNVCTKLQACRLRERNCERRNLGKPALRQTRLSRCSGVKGATGSARCVGKSVGSLRCGKSSCVGQKPDSCWRDQKGRSLWLSECAARKRNCRNAKQPQRQLTRVSAWNCKIRPLPIEE